MAIVRKFQARKKNRTLLECEKTTTNRKFEISSGWIPTTEHVL